MKRAFTLVEVLVAMAVLATISAGLLVTAWRLVGFARDEAEHMVADAYCHDVTWAVYRQKYAEMLDGATERTEGDGKVREATWEIIADPEGVKAQAESNPAMLKDKLKELPWVETVNFFGDKVVTIPLWRTMDLAKVPTCRVKVLERIDENEFDGKVVTTNKTITVSVTWWKDSGTAAAHSNVVTRTTVD